MLAAATVAYLFGRFQARGVGAPPPPDGGPHAAAASSRGRRPPFGDYKLALCVRTDLGMSKDKMAAQAGHAAVGAYAGVVDAGDPAGWVAGWRRYGEAKIALAVGGEGQIRQLEAAGKRHGVPVYLVVDAGRTQIAAVRRACGGGASGSPWGCERVELWGRGVTVWVGRGVLQRSVGGVCVGALRSGARETGGAGRF